jgi:hypothetical protein
MLQCSVRLYSTLSRVSLLAGAPVTPVLALS